MQQRSQNDVGREITIHKEKPVPLPLCPHKIPHGLARYQTWAPQSLVTNCLNFGMAYSVHKNQMKEDINSPGERTRETLTKLISKHFINE